MVQVGQGPGTHLTEHPPVQGYPQRFNMVPFARHAINECYSPSNGRSLTPSPWSLGHK